MSMGTLTMVTAAVGGVLHGADAPFDSVSTDTRTLQPGQLFFALRGAHHDGAEHVAQAAQLGAAGAVVRAHLPIDLPQIVVANTQLALGQLARGWRERHSLPVIGITGSNGKTTVKEMTAAIMRAACETSATPDAGIGAVLVTQGNFNNEIGLPLTLLCLTASHRAAVIEMGAARPGDITYLARIALPTVGVVTNAGRAHLQGFGSVEDVAATKGEIFSALGASGTAIINRDDRFFASWWERSIGRRRLTFGLHVDADFRAIGVTQAPDGAEIRFLMHTPAGEIPVVLAMAGPHNVLNALAAAAACAAAGAPLEAVARGLGAARNVAGRLRLVAGRAQCRIYDDSYNANPGSVRAAIAFLEQLPGERWLVLGDMAELGPDSSALHREIGAAASAAGLDALLCTGPFSHDTADGFGASAEWFATLPELIAHLQARLRPGVTVLVKGSRSAGMERVVQALAAPAGG